MHADSNPLGGNVGLPGMQVAYRVRDAAPLVGLSERQMWELVRTGEVTSFKIGTSRRIAREDLEEFIARKKAASLEADDTHPPAGPSTPPPPSGPGKFSGLRRAG